MQIVIAPRADLAKQGFQPVRLQPLLRHGRVDIGCVFHGCFLPLLFLIVGDSAVI